MADDLGYECLGSYGGTSYNTPNLDALAKGGVLLQWKEIPAAELSGNAVHVQ